MHKLDSEILDLCTEEEIVEEIEQSEEIEQRVEQAKWKVMKLLCRKTSVMSPPKHVSENAGSTSTGSNDQDSSHIGHGNSD